MRWPLQALVLLLLFFASGEALASPALGPEIEVDPGVFVGTEGSLPAVAWDGTNYFVVSGGPGCCASPSVLSGTRVSANGTVLDSGGIALDAAGGTAAVAYGAGYFVVATTNCHAIRVASDGTVADSTPITLASQEACSGPAVSFDGTNFLVAETVTPSSAQVAQIAWRVSPGGSVLDSTPIQVNARPTGNNSVARSAFDGGTHVFLYSVASPVPFTGPSLMVRQVKPDGSFGGESVVSTVDTLAADIACDGTTGCLAVWMGPGSSLQGARIGLDGSTLDPSGFPISHSSPPSGTVPRVTWDGAHYLVVWVSGSTLVGDRVSGNTVVDSADIVIGSFPTAPGLPGMASSPSGSLLAWEPSAGLSVPYPSEQALRVDDTLTAQAQSFPFSLTIPDEQSQAVASNGTGYLVAWADERGLVAATRLDSTGTPQDVPSLVLTSTGRDSAVAAVGSNYLVTWTEESQDGFGDIYGAIVPGSGPPGSPFVISGRHGGGQAAEEVSPFVATNGASYLVAWIDSREGQTIDAGNGMTTFAGGPDIYAARVSPSGSVDDPAGIQITTGGLGSHWSSIASDGADYLFTVAVSGAVTAIPVSGSGAVGSPVLVLDGADGGEVGSVSVGGSGGQYAAEWSVWANGGVAPNIFGALLGPAGAPSAPGVFDICSGAGCNNGLVAPVGGDFYAIWFQFHAGDPDTFYNLYGTTIDLNGAVASPNGELLTSTTSSGSSDGPSLAMRTSTQGLLVYNTPGTGVEARAQYRTRARLIAFDGLLPDGGTSNSDGGTGNSDGGTGNSDGGAGGAADGGTEDATLDDAGPQGGDATMAETDASLHVGENGDAALAGVSDAAGSGEEKGGGSSGGCSMGGGDAHLGTPALLMLAAAALIARRSRPRTSRAWWP